MYIQLQNFGYNSSIKSTYHEGKYECIERIHQFPEIVYIIDGSVDITVDGIRETAKAGDIAVITPFRTHSFHTPTYCKIWIGVISSDFVTDFISGENLIIRGKRAIFTPTPSLKAYVSAHFPKVYNIQTELGTDVIQYRGIKALVYAVFEEYTRTVPQLRSQSTNNALAALFVYLSEHYRENIDLESVSTALGYTSTYVSHCIAALPNMSFRKLLNSLRVDHAKNALISNDFRLIDIALECGFTSERTFYRAFMEMVGLTPTEYRNLKKN